MKTNADKTVLEDLQQVLSIEDSILDSLTSEIDAESPVYAESVEKNEKKVNLNNNILLGIIADQAKSKLVWQCITVCLSVFVLIASFICFGFYTSRGNLAEKLGEIKILERKLEVSQAEIGSVKADAIKSDTELKNAQSELNNSRAKIKELQAQLADAARQIETLQERNAQAVKLLNGRLQKLSTQPNITPNRSGK